MHSLQWVVAVAEEAIKVKNWLITVEYKKNSWLWLVNFLPLQPHPLLLLLIVAAITVYVYYLNVPLNGSVKRRASYYLNVPLNGSVKCRAYHSFKWPFRLPWYLYIFICAMGFTHFSHFHVTWLELCNIVQSCEVIWLGWTYFASVRKLHYRLIFWGGPISMHWLPI